MAFAFFVRLWIKGIKLLHRTITKMISLNHLVQHQVIVGFFDIREQQCEVILFFVERFLQNHSSMATPIYKIWRHWQTGWPIIGLQIRITLLLLLLLFDVF